MKSVFSASFPVILAALLGAITVPSASVAAETVVMSAGDPGGAMITLAFDKDTTPRTILVRTHLAGVEGSVLSIYVDKSTTPTFRHTYASDECRFPDGGASVCKISIAETEPAYAAIVSIFKDGKEARLVVEDAGAMAMDHTASLIGFTKSFDE